MTQPKQAGNTKAAFVIITLGLLVFAASKYPFYFAAGAILLIGILVFAYLKVPKFHTFINSKLPFKKSKKLSDAELRKWYIEHGFVSGTPTAQTRQDNGTIPSQIVSIRDFPMCNKPGCGGPLEPIANMPKYMLCTTCGKIQQKI